MTRLPDTRSNGPLIGRLLAACALVVALVALAVSIAAMREARRTPTSSEVGAASIARFSDLMGQRGITREQVREILGSPQAVFRRNPRAECWAYTTPAPARMCFGPKRHLAWAAWSGDGVRGDPPG